MQRLEKTLCYKPEVKNCRQKHDPVDEDMSVISWQEWETVKTINPKTKNEISKRQVVSKTGSSKLLITELLEEIEFLSQHLFVAIKRAEDNSDDTAVDEDHGCNGDQVVLDDDCKCNKHSMFEYRCTVRDHSLVKHGSEHLPAVITNIEEEFLWIRNYNSIHKDNWPLQTNEYTTQETDIKRKLELPDLVFSESRYCFKFDI
ncbi:unnamed protein product [Mytilus edulis]|uniref:Uncharacterized protein n=1 Tax=Mytilus edulis TaxID=6550 RepID=A0A8S3VNV7_MYTED|nr:unnamed protein product [Mytilus edulis]